MLKIGLIGCGFMGSMHANCYQNINGAQVTAVADLRPEKAEALASLSGAAIYADGKDLIANADVDAIDICLPTYLHAEYATLAMKKVKYVFVEKPVALTVEEGNALVAAAKETGANVQIGQVIRFWDEYVELAKILKDQRFGKVISANFRRLSPVPTWGWENWLLDAKRSGGAGQDLHIHDIDYVLSVFGEPQSFTSAKNTLGNTNDFYVRYITQNSLVAICYRSKTVDTLFCVATVCLYHFCTVFFNFYHVFVIVIVNCDNCFFANLFNFYILQIIVINNATLAL